MNILLTKDNIFVEISYEFDCSAIEDHVKRSQVLNQPLARDTRTMERSEIKMQSFKSLFLLDL
jgi:hypothetical protein